MTSEAGGQAPDLNETPADVDLGRVWLGVTAVMWRRRPGPVERLAGRLLRSPGLARAMLTTPSLLLPWLVATIAVLVGGVLATLGSGQPVVELVAPGLAGAGIAYAYGPGVDPAWELSRSMAISDRMVLLVRALAVFAVNAALSLAAAAASSTAAGFAFAWLVPMTAVCALALAAATLTRSANVGVATGMAGWIITILAGQAFSGAIATAISGPVLMLPYALVAVACVGLVIYTTRTPKETRWVSGGTS